MDGIRYNSDRGKIAEKSCFTVKSFFPPTLHTKCFVFIFCFVFSEAKPLSILRVLWNLSFSFFQKFFIRQVEKFENMKLTKLKNQNTKKETPKLILQGSKNVLTNHDIFRFILYFWASQILHYQKWGMLWTVHSPFFPAQTFTYTEQIYLLVGRASGPTKITDPEFESLSTTLISCYCHRPLLSSLGLCSPNSGLVLHSCPPLITQLRSPEEVVQDAFVNTPSHTGHLPSPLLL